MHGMQLGEGGQLMVRKNMSSWGWLVGRHCKINHLKEKKHMLATMTNERRERDAEVGRRGEINIRHFEYVEDYHNNAKGRVQL